MNGCLTRRRSPISTRIARLSPIRSAAVLSFICYGLAARFRDDLSILVAGCGTSQAARYAIRHPNAQVTGIDISETSLAHTRKLQSKYGLNNLELQRLPVERAEELKRSFDLVVCTGVLHHLPDPSAGLRALRAVLAPEGAMRLMVYARYGRAGIYMIQDYCRLLGISTSTEDLRQLGAALGDLPADHPIMAVMRRAKDFRVPEAMADALLHPQDRSYTVPELYAWLEQSGVAFGRWNEQAPYLATCGAVARSAHAARLAALPAPRQHAAVELFRGAMTTHSFIAYSDSAMAERQTPDVSDRRWDAAIPLRRAHTLTLHERLPAGAAAVLINRQHTSSDLALPIDAFEDRLLSGIDGRRTVGEIVGGMKDEGRARAFLAKLWAYDQVVFGAGPFSSLLEKVSWRSHDG